MLGGKTKDRLPVYSTSSRPDLAKEMGFVGAKIPCPYGPAAGDEGLRKNVAFFKGWREKVGDDFPLMLDCYMALTVPYAIQVSLLDTIALITFCSNFHVNGSYFRSWPVLCSPTSSSGWRSSSPL